MPNLGVRAGEGWGRLSSFVKLVWLRLACIARCFLTPARVGTVHCMTVLASSVGRHPALLDEYICMLPPENTNFYVRSGPTAQHCLPACLCPFVTRTKSERQVAPRAVEHQRSIKQKENPKVTAKQLALMCSRLPGVRTCSEELLQVPTQFGRSKSICTY